MCFLVGVISQWSICGKFIIIKSNSFFILEFVGSFSPRIIAQVKNTSKTTLIQKYNELGPITFHEIAVCTTFVTLIILWMFRDPQFLTGWSRMLGHDM